MTPEQKRTWEVVVGLVVGLASVATTLLAYDVQLDGAILGEIRPRARWAWRCVVAGVASWWHGPEIVAGAEKDCEESPWRPTWNRVRIHPSGLRPGYLREYRQRIEESLEDE